MIHGLEPSTDLDGVQIRATPRRIVDEDLGAAEVFFSENHQHAGNVWRGCEVILRDFLGLGLDGIDKSAGHCAEETWCFLGGLSCVRSRTG